MRTILSLVSIALLVGAACCNAQKINSSHIRSVTAITEVFGDGQKVTAAAVEFDKAIDNSNLTAATFSVAGRTITRVYANQAAAKTSAGMNGNFAIIELSTADAGAATFVQKGWMSTRLAPRVSVKQAGDVITADGEQYASSSDALSNDRTVNLIVDDFKQLVFRDAKTGKSVNYNLFVPKNYDPNKAYPLVMFIHDAGVTSTNALTTLVQGLGAAVWASPSEQVKHECFVLAPQYSSQIVNDNSEASDDLEATVNLINALENQYHLDTNRLYATGQSGGCMMSIAMNIKYPDLFAASFLVAGQWDPAKVAPLTKAKWWIIVSAGDLKAFPGMNDITATLEKGGAKVSRATWSGQASATEFATDVSQMLAAGANINYTVLQKGTVVPAGMRDDGGSNHLCTWRIAYNIEGVRDWVFAQTK